MMERNPRAPVSAALARCAMATRAAWEKCSRMPSASKSARYLRYHEPRNRLLRPGRTAAPQPQTGPLRGSAARGRVRSVARSPESQHQEASVVSRGTAQDGALQGAALLEQRVARLRHNVHHLGLGERTELGVHLRYRVPGA